MGWPDIYPFLRATSRTGDAEKLYGPGKVALALYVARGQEDATAAAAAAAALTPVPSARALLPAPVPAPPAHPRVLLIHEDPGSLFGPHLHQCVQYSFTEGRSLVREAFGALEARVLEVREGLQALNPAGQGLVDYIIYIINIDGPWGKSASKLGRGHTGELYRGIAYEAHGMLRDNGLLAGGRVVVVVRECGCEGEAPGNDAAGIAPTASREAAAAAAPLPFAGAGGAAPVPSAAPPPLAGLLGCKQVQRLGRPSRPQAAETATALRWAAWSCTVTRTAAWKCLTAWQRCACATCPWGATPWPCFSRTLTPAAI